jgi:serine/threonine-protein kinase
MKNETIKFIRTKDYKFIDDIGQGGTGKTILLEDQIINERFVCKKYSTYYPEDQPLYFSYFKDEIKLLHRLYHKNVVRVFNYYLYPKKTTGYILMEFIKGDKISTYLKQNPNKLNDIFIQTIEGFVHLEENTILHRDIRPDNILVSDDGVVKIIDFGFGKKVSFEEDFDKSISLNWRYGRPQDFEDGIYNFCTEIYFIGKLFQEIISENNFENFGFNTILEKMVSPRYEDRFTSFFNIHRNIISNGASAVGFSEEETRIYQFFANSLSNILSKINHDSEYITETDVIINNLENLYQNSILEFYIQNNNALANCFLKGQFRYYRNHDTEVNILKEFLDFIKSIAKDKQKIVINNLWQRLDYIQRLAPVIDDELPF